MEAWQRLSDVETNEVWDRFYELFDFKPSINFEDFPGIREPIPSITYQFDYPLSDESLEDIDNKTLNVLRSVVSSDDLIYVLDWQHQCYSLCPHIPFHEWMIPVVPNGDYYIFLAKDFSFGIFGHPWEQTFCVWGKNLLAAFEKYKPILFETVIRHTDK